MDVKYSKFYQLGNGGDLIFERDLHQLLELLERPHPEFFGAQLNDQGGEDLQWLIVASLRGKIEPPTVEGIQFTLRENNWLDGLARACRKLFPVCVGRASIRSRVLALSFSQGVMQMDNHWKPHTTPR